MSDPTELNDLQGLVEHPGWARFKAGFAAEWGPAGSRYIANLERLANNTDREQAVVDLQQIIAVRKALEAVVASVEARVQDLVNRRGRPYDPSRRGTL